MIWSITKSNIKKNFSLYRIYFLATIGLLSIFIAFLNFISDKIITEKIGDSGQALVIANGSLVFLTVFLVIFLIYFNNFFVKKRINTITDFRKSCYSSFKLLGKFTIGTDLIFFSGTGNYSSIGINIGSSVVYYS